MPKVNDYEESFIKIEIPKDPLQQIYGQEGAKRALQVALAGEFSICFYGATGQGKTSLLNIFKKFYAKLYRRQPSFSVVECDGYPSTEFRSCVIFAKIEKLNYGVVHLGKLGSTSGDFLKSITSKLEQQEYFVAGNFWDTVGGTYSRDGLTPKSLFSALKVSRIIANMEQSEIILKKHLQEALKLVTFPSKRVQTEKT